jgi:RNA polymerase sigma-70 factor (ECF subfamily)
MIHSSPSSVCEEPFENQPARGDAALLVTYLDAAYNLARWLMRNETEAQDVVQEAYVRAISRFASFRGGDGRAWFLTIIRNGCYDRMKQRGKSAQNANFDEAIHSSCRQMSNPETALLLAERTELLKKSLAELPAEYREVLVLRELEELSYRQIADIVAVPLGTVMSRLSRARQRLQQALWSDSEREVTNVTITTDARTCVTAEGDTQ